jgi:ADP-ribosylglycohydrolase
MLGAIVGDFIGSICEAAPIKSRELPRLSRGATLTDDTVCTVALADALLTGRDFAQCLRAYVRCYPDPGVRRHVRTPGRRTRLASAAMSHDQPDAIAGAEATTLAPGLARAMAPAIVCARGDRSSQSSSTWPSWATSRSTSESRSSISRPRCVSSRRFGRSLERFPRKVV